MDMNKEGATLKNIEECERIKILDKRSTQVEEASS